MKNIESNNNTQSDFHRQGRKNKKLNLENSPDNEKFDKSVEELTKYIVENSTNENELLKMFVFFTDISKKSKYQTKIIETPILINKMKEILLRPSSNPEISIEVSKIIMNISKNHNSQNKLIFETSLNFNTLFEILLVNLNTNLTYNLLMAFSYLTESKEIMDNLMNANKKRNNLYRKTNSLRQGENLDQSTKVSQLISKLELSTMTRTFAEKILDDLISSNKKVLLKILENLYNYNSTFITKEAIEPLVRCLGNKSNDVVINALKILLFFTKDKSFHNDLLNANFIFRLVRTYKQGIDEMDVVIVKILYDLFDNKNLYEVLFENNVLLILSNYLMNFEVEKNEKYEEVIRNVFEIFKLINKNTDEENNKIGHSTLQNPLVDDENLQLLIFKKSYSLAAFSKSEPSILSCLSLLQIMLSKFSSTLLNTNENIKSIIELVPPFFKNKNMDIIKHSLSIFEIILNKKGSYFQESYVQSSNQTFSIKSLVHSVINLVNEYSGNYELLSMSCRILVTLSDIPRLQAHFLQEPQITVLKVFNDNLLKKQKQLKKEKINIEERLNAIKNNENNLYDTNSNRKNGFDQFKRGEGMAPICEQIERDNEEDEKIINTNTKKTSQKNNNINPIDYFSKSKIKLSPREKEPIKAIDLRKLSGTNNSSVGTSKNEEKDRYYLTQIEKKIQENIYLLKDSFTIISNLSKNADNLEVLTLKGFLDVINEKLNDNDSETLPYVTRCIQGFCQAQTSIDIILKMQIINKILGIYKLYRIEDEKNKKINIDSNKEYNYQSNNNNNQKISVWATTAKRLEVLKCLKNILESDIKLQRTFIIEKGIEILLNDVVSDSSNINEIVSDQLNEMILRVIYVVSCNINKLFLIYFNSEENSVKNESLFNYSSESESESEDEKNEINTNTTKNKKAKNKLKFKNDDSNSEKSSKNDDDDNIDKNNSLTHNTIQKRKEKLLKIFKEQLSEKKFMNKLTEVGEYDFNSLSTYRELIKIFINLYLNRYYLKYFTTPKNFDKVINIINNVMKKYKENTTNDNNYEILKLVIIFLKFICEDENLIRKFLKEDVISILFEAIIENEFYDNSKEEEIKQFYYNFSLVLLRLTEINGHISKFKLFPEFLKTLEKLYDINLMNGKIYIISIIRNIIAEDVNFFNEEDLAKFLDKIVSQKNSFIIYEFVELIKNLVHSRSMCKRMEKVFKYLISEIESSFYSLDFKKKMLDLILCLSYENANIKDYSLQELLALVKNLDININEKTTLLILMNFSSLSSNFAFLMEDYKEPKYSDNKKKFNFTKKGFIEMINHLIDSDKFSQILIQRLLINITSIDGIDMSIISIKIMKILLEILIKNQNMEDNIIIFSLATLVNISNRNLLKFEKTEEEKNTKDKKKNDRNSSSSFSEEDEKEENEPNKKEEEEKSEDKKEDKENEENDNMEKDSKNMIINTDINVAKNKEVDNPRKKKITFIFDKLKTNKNLIRKNKILLRNNSIKELKEDDDNGIKEIKEVVLIEYIFEEIKNLTEIIKSLFNKGSLDISSLTIMLCCNLLRKIKTSKYQNYEKEIIDCIEKYIEKEKILNHKDNGESLLKNESGKFLLISIIKYFICLSVEDNNDLFFNNLNNSNIPKIIMDVLKYSSSGTNKLKHFKIDTDDIKENTINFACVENQLTFFNLILLIGKKKDATYFYEYQSYNELRKNIKLFFEEFISNFSKLLSELQNSVYEKNKNKYLLQDNENNNEKNNLNDKNKTDNTENSNKDNININIDDKSKDKNKKDTNIEINLYDDILLRNQTIQNILISCFKILIEYLIDIDYFISKDKNKNRNIILDEENLEEFIDKDKDKENIIIKKEINIQFYNKISSSFEQILICLLNESPQHLFEELTSLIIYILFLIFSNILENKEKEEKEKEKEKNDNNNNGDLNLKKIETHLDENTNLQKWLMKIFISNKKSIQNDFFCLKIFTISIHNDNFPEIFYQSSKFIKKLMSYLKYNGADKKKRILKIECERFLNIISFNPKSHSVLYSMGVYGIFKSNLYSKVANNKSQKNKSSKQQLNNNSVCQKEDFILLVNMILNKNNKEFIKDDIQRILQNIFPSKDLANNLRVELFDIYMNSAFDIPNEKQFHEDYLIIFNLLYENLKDSFSEMIFLFDKFTKTYQSLVKKFLLEDKMIINMFYDFLKFDKNFPSKPEELNSYLKILELYLEVGEMSEEFKNMLQDFMKEVTKDKVRDNLRDINILHSILNFAFLFYIKYCEKKNLIEINNNEEENLKKEKMDEDEEEESDESSSDSSEKKKKDEKNLKIKEKLKEFIIKYNYSKLIDNIIYNAVNYNEIKGVYILSMLIIQDDYKSMLAPLKEIGSQLFNKNFLLGFFTKFIDKKLDIKEFVFVIHLSIVISNVGTDGIDCIEEIINEIIEIYKKYLIKNLSNTRNLIYGSNINMSTNSNNDIRNENSNNNEDNGARINNGGSGNLFNNGIDNGGGNQNVENISGQIRDTNNNNYFNETVTSIYFFCDLVKTNELSISGIGKVLDFLVFIISDVKNLSIEQKEILIRYYQEILLHYRINTDEELINHFNFLNKIHNDKAINFIENLTFGTILINTRKDILLNNINEFLNIVSLICFNNDTNLIDIDKKTLINLYKFCKQICIILNFNSNQNNNMNNNGFNKQGSDNKIKLAFHNLESYVNKTISNSMEKIKNDPELFKKFDKLSLMIQTCINT